MNKKQLIGLLEKMTIDEKVGQLTQLDGSFFQTENQEITGPIYEASQITKAQVYTLGSVLGVYGVENIRKIQNDYLKKSRLKVPLLFMADVVHGAHTIFPIPLGLSTSFNLDLAQKSAEVAAKEATASGLHVTFAPMVDLLRDPRWGRVMEGTGEDYYLNSLYASAFTKGFQGNFDDEHLAACVKHFAAYGAVEAGREYNIVDIPENKLREQYLPAYKAAIDSGIKLVMTSFNTVNGIPSSGNQWLMKEILRDEWGFDGVVITDYGAVMEQIEWGTAINEKDAAKQSLSATIDIEMMTTAYLHQLKNLVDTDKNLERLMNEAVLRVLELKNTLGLFEDPYRKANVKREETQIFTDENKQIAYEVASESLVLLKNDNQILPLKSTDKVTFSGPLYHTRDLLGAWHWKGNLSQTESISSALSTYESVPLDQAEKVIIFVGENSHQTGESKSYTDIQLSKSQQEHIDDLAKKTDQIILVVLAGRPLDLSSVNDKVSAIIYVYFPGTMGARVIADTLYGKINPSGKLTMSLPRSVGQIPIYYNNYNTGRPTQTEDEEYVSRYQNCLKTPLYPFGHGLSYSKFSYKDPSVSISAEQISLSITVKNESTIPGKNTILIFVRDLVGSTTRPLKELKDFQKVKLAPSEQKRVNFIIQKNQLKLYNFKNDCIFEPGDFELFIANSSEDIIYHKIITL